MNQTDFAAVGGVGRKSQFNYEEDERQPDAAYLAAISAVGADVLYILTGSRETPPPEVLAPDERYLLERYRGSPQSLRDAALRVLLGGEPPSAGRSKFSVTKNHGQVVEGGMVNTGPITFGSGKGSGKK